MRGLLLTVTFALSAEPMGAQGKTKFGSGQYGAYRQELAELSARASALIDEIGNFDTGKRYCTAAERAKDGRDLVALRMRINELRDAYNTFKGRISTAVATPIVLKQFTDAGEDPGSTQFWTKADQDILRHPLGDLTLKVNAFAKNAPIDCNPPKTSAAPRPTPVPSADPLAGFTRPPKYDKPNLPAMPKPFCSPEELYAWYRANLRPLMDANSDAGWALTAYAGKLWDRIERLSVADSIARRALQAEFDWAIKTHREQDKWYAELIAFYERLTVVDCSPQTTGGPPKIDVPGGPPKIAVPAVDTVKPPQSQTTNPPNKAPEPKKAADEPKKADKDGKVGYAPKLDWHIGAGAEYSYFHSFESTAGDQANISSFTGKSGAPGWGVSAGLGYGPWDLTVSTHSNTLTYVEEFANTGFQQPTRLSARLRGRFHDACLGRRFRLGRVETLTYVGLTYAIDRLTFDETFGGAPATTGERTLTHWKSNLGVSLDYPLAGGVSARLGATYTTSGKGGDADMNSRVSLGLRYSPGFLARF